MQLHAHTPSIWTIKHFLPETVCASLIHLSETTGYEEAKVNFSTGAEMMKGLRNNYRLLYPNAELAAEFWQSLRHYCPDEIDGQKASGLNEMFRFYKYSSSQRFKRHIDGRFRRSAFEESRITFMIYLNDDFEGGETAFDEVEIKPETGTALCFIHEQKHEGKPVLSGAKYVLRSDVMYTHFPVH
ncbi:MAG: 2OG-Fe(II) oxygenase [Bacteroidetes bacterium]|nr:2OG-Fe(II) oxygenase [Bacteroidota bacterium]